MRDPGLRRKEDFPSGTRSAAIGGVTTVADMPNTVPPVTTTAALDAKAAELHGRATVDYALYAAPQSREAVSRLGNAAAFKVYMAESTGNLEVPVPRLEEILRAAEAQPKLVVVHAEDPGKFTKQKARDLRGYDAARPKVAEEAAITTLARIRGGARVHVAHVTCPEALNSVPAGATCEATPHHLFLDWSKPLGARGKVNPRSDHPRIATRSGTPSVRAASTRSRAITHRTLWTKRASPSRKRPPESPAWRRRSPSSCVGSGRATWTSRDSSRRWRRDPPRSWGSRRGRSMWAGTETSSWWTHGTSKPSARNACGTNAGGRRSRGWKPASLEPYTSVEKGSSKTARPSPRDRAD